MSNVNGTKATEKQSNVRKTFKLKFFNSKNVFILFFCLTILFSLLAVLIFYAQSGKFIKHFDYTDCLSRNPSVSLINSDQLHYKLHRLNLSDSGPNSSGQRHRSTDCHSSDCQSASNSSRNLSNDSSSSFSSNSSHHSPLQDSSIRTCMASFHLTEDTYETLYIHYQLNNYYKNFMSFSSSYSNKQVFGDFDTYVLDQCNSQTDHDELYHADNNTCAIAPCGELPNFMFNDTVRIYYHPNATTKIPIEISSRYLTDSYFDQNFNNPDQKAMPIVQRYTKRPRNWQKNIFELDPADHSNNGFRHQRLIVWMYPNPFSDFAKLYGKITHAFDSQIARYFEHFAPANKTKPSGKKFLDGQSPYLRKGNYSLEVTYNYPLWSRQSFKRFSISTVGTFGQDNQMFKAFICLAAVVSFLSTIIVYLIYRFHDNKYRMYISRLSNADVQF